LPQWHPGAGDELLVVGSTSPAEALLPEYGYRDLFGSYEDPTASNIGLYLINADGSDLRPITPTSGGMFDYGLVAWTPAGDRILTQTMDPAGYIKVRVLGADGGLLRTIEPTTGAMTVNPVVSPDGRRVAYADMTDAERWTIRTEALDGSGGSTATDASFPGIAASFRWSPDGRKFIVSHHFYKETWLFDADGGPGQRATWTDPGSNSWQRVAP